MCPRRLVNFSPGFSFARFPIHCKYVSALTSSCAEHAFRAADFPLAAPLPSTGSTGVTRVFVGFSGTTNASDSSEACCADCGLSPSRLPLPRAFDRARDEDPPRSPDSRARDICEHAVLLDPGGRDGSSSALVGTAPWPAAGGKGGGSLIDGISGLYHPARSRALLRFTSWVAPRGARTGLPGGGLLPG